MGKCFDFAVKTEGSKRSFLLLIRKNLLFFIDNPDISMYNVCIIAIFPKGEKHASRKKTEAF